MKRSGYVAAALLKEGRKVIGLLMGGCNGDTASDAAKHMSPPYAYKLVPIFLSGGTTDTIADPSMIHWVERSMRSNGFRKVRFESYQGGHDVYPEQRPRRCAGSKRTVGERRRVPYAQIRLRFLFQEAVACQARPRSLRLEGPKPILAP